MTKRLSRRAVLSAGAAWTLAGLPVELLAARKKRRRRRGKKGRKRRRRPPVERVNGAINIQPIRRFDVTQEPRDLDPIPAIVDEQMRALYELGFESIRLTLSYSNLGLNLLGAIPYVRAARSLGIEVLGILGQFGHFHSLVQRLSDPAKRDFILDGYLELYNRPVAPAAAGIRPGRFTLQFLNEPTNFLGIRPRDYVRHFLAPAYERLKSRDPNLLIVSAAPVGGNSGVLRAREMFEAGVESFCDRVGLHVYERSIIPDLARLPTKPVWITETGAVGPENHLGWVLEVYPELEATIPAVERIFFFELFDLAPGQFRILDISQSETDVLDFDTRIESHDLYNFWESEVLATTGGAPRARYRDLVPDITAYWPTDADKELVFALDNI